MGRRGGGAGPVTLPRILRGGALAIVLLALWDPALPSNRRSDLVVAVVPQPGAEPTAEEVAGALASRFTVVRGPWPEADATVLVGDRLPSEVSDLRGPVVMVLPSSSPPLRLEGVEVASRVPLRARVPVEVTVATEPPHPPAVELLLRHGPVVVDRVSLRPDPATGRGRGRLTFLPPALGPARLEVEARAGPPPSGTAAGSEGLPERAGPGSLPESLPAREAFVVEVEDRPWNVLFFDPRPSWMSTFVRRALEADPRFRVSARVATSPEQATEVGAPPRSLTDSGALTEWEVLVLGSPEVLSAEELRGVDGFLRARGGGVLLLPERRDAPPPEALAGPLEWRGYAAADPLAVMRSRGDQSLEIDDGAWQGSPVPSPPPLRSPSPFSGAFLLAAALAWPEPLPPGAVPLAVALVPGAPAPRPVVWSLPVGAGSLVVSGALDAWRFRDPERSAFEAAWREIVAEVASGVPRPLEGRLREVWPGTGRRDIHAPVPPGAWVAVEVVVRNAALAPPSGERRAPARLRVGEADGLPLSLHPSGPPGYLHARFRAPLEPGLHTVRVEVGAAALDLPLVVDPDRPLPGPPPRELLARWAAATGGMLLSPDRIREAAGAVERAVDPPDGPESRRPMRSPWWIVPLALLLSGEWWWRRHRGLP